MNESNRLRIWCVGNALLGDDAVGCRVAELLSEMGATDVVDCGTAPENYTATLRKNPPAELLIVDAADMGLSPGECRRLSIEELDTAGETSHGVAPSLLFAPFTDFIAISALGIQPSDLRLGAPLSDAAVTTRMQTPANTENTAKMSADNPGGVPLAGGTK